MELSEDILKKGFWYYRPNEVPDSITYPEEYNGGTRLSVSCTQTDLNPNKQRKLVEKWCETLPLLNKVEYLFFHTKVPQSIFESVCLMPNLVGLYIKWSGIKDISSLSKLNSLRFFHLGSSSQVESINVFRNLGYLIWLDLENVKKIHDFSPLLNLQNLIGLWLEGSMWTTQIADSLEPVSHLKNLQHLSIINLRTNDKTILHLANLKRLKYLRAPLWYEKEFNDLKRFIPGLEIVTFQTLN